MEGPPRPWIKFLAMQTKSAHSQRYSSRRNIRREKRHLEEQ